MRTSKSICSYPRGLVLGGLMLAYFAYELWEHHPLSLAILESDLLHALLLESVVFTTLLLIAYRWSSTTRPDRIRKMEAAKDRTRRKVQAIPPPRVLVVGNESILGAGVERLLNQAGDLEVSGIAPRDPEDLLERAWNYQPRVIVVDESSYSMIDAELLSIFQSSPRVTVLGLNSTGSSARLFDKRRIPVRDLADLIKLIRDA